MTFVLENDPPRVLNKSRGATNGVYVGRPSKYGNPFEIGKDGTRDQVIAKYQEWIMKQSTLIEDAKRELRGKNLICWCAPKKCHATILLHLANDIT